MLSCLCLLGRSSAANASEVLVLLKRCASAECCVHTAVEWCCCCCSSGPRPMLPVADLCCFVLLCAAGDDSIYMLPAVLLPDVLGQLPASEAERRAFARSLLVQLVQDPGGLSVACCCRCMLPAAAAATSRCLLLLLLPCAAWCCSWCRVPGDRLPAACCRLPARPCACVSAVLQLLEACSVPQGHAHWLLLGCCCLPTGAMQQWQKACC